ncbi:MAG: YscO family type III secretion system apparatus protein [Desulfobacterium sp.]|nr:YscO family type III secretion system apparatus protein [Desulfobacterium sp.]
MIVYPLATLLKLRIFRQDKAMHLLQTCERELTKARNLVKKAIKDHESFLIWLAREEETRYQEIMGKKMTLNQVDEFKAGLLAIRARESLYLEKILKARQTVDLTEQKVAKAKQDLLAAQKGTLKIEAHREKWLEVAEIEAERAEEIEMEDFIPKKNDGFASEANL